MRLLVDAGESMAALAADIEAASDSVLAQTMTFEGDVAGRSFANLLIRGGCRDRRLVVDAYSRHVLSCRWLHSPAAGWDAELRAEVRATQVTHEALARGGVGVRYVNPTGFLLRRMAARSHKKSVVVDGRISYLGGLNFSDHNFCWHDLMLRIDDRAVAGHLAEDLEASWRGRRIRGWREYGGVAIGILDGRHNARDFEPVLDLVAGARDDILIETAYLTFPFIDRLREAARRGVHVVSAG
jgi:cardiolipin synthase